MFRFEREQKIVNNHSRSADTGGTGKTTMAASFTVLTRDSIIADCDVDTQTFIIFCTTSS